MTSCEHNHTQKAPRPEVLLYDVPGTYSFAIGEDTPSDVSGLVVKLWGGGGAGGTSPDGQVVPFFAGSGGGSAYILLSGITTAVNGRYYTLHVGSGGQPVYPLPNQGGSGEASTFLADNKSLAVAAGGGGGGQLDARPGRGGVATITATSPNVRIKSYPGKDGSSGNSTSGLGGAAAFGGVPGTQGFDAAPGNLPQVPGAGGAGSSLQLIPDTAGQAGSNGAIEIHFITSL
jgi:hypothetical protein